MACECAEVVMSGWPAAAYTGAEKLVSLGLHEGGRIILMRASGLNDLPEVPLLINGRSWIQVQVTDSQTQTFSAPPPCLQTSATHDAADLGLNSSPATNVLCVLSGGICPL